MEEASGLPRENASQRLAVLLAFHAFDVCAEFAQFFIEMFVTPIDVIDAAHFGNSVRL
jgi:hypothetical protein